jgi:NADH-quinone oxidoreductase subunit E
LKEEVGVGPGQISEDGTFSLEEVECLGHCGTAPVVQVNGEFYEEMDVDKMKALLATLK